MSSGGFGSFGAQASAATSTGGAFGGRSVFALPQPQPQPQPQPSLLLGTSAKAGDLGKAIDASQKPVPKLSVLKPASEAPVLPEHDAEHFQIFFSFVYARHIFSTTVGDKDKDGGVEDDAEWHRLAQAYALGSYLQAGDFKDAVTDAIIQKAGSLPSGQQRMHTVIYPNSTPDSGVRRLLVDVACYGWSIDYLQSQSNATQWSDFFLERSISLHANRGKELKGSPYAHSNTCTYHDHGTGSGSSCYRTKFPYPV
ncbi:hypothetical protein LTR85_010340 [Meristemomyces frigidus]|nr:hypothetical protein LTR85_010340 [Meristemomyces frigidus]